MNRAIVLAAGAALACAAAICPGSSVLAAAYPVKPITLMIGFAPGGPSDVMARILTRKMEDILKLEATTWHGFVAPAGTPKEVVATIHRAAVAALTDAEVRKALTDLGVEVVANRRRSFAPTSSPKSRNGRRS